MYTAEDMNAVHGLLVYNEEDVKLVLARAREIIRKEKNWTKEYEARDSSGKECQATSNDACAYCAWGALEAAGGSEGARFAASWVLFDVIREDILFMGRGNTPQRVIQGFNDDDDTNHRLVLSAFGLAIENIGVVASRLRVEWGLDEGLEVDDVRPAELASTLDLLAKVSSVHNEAMEAYSMIIRLPDRGDLISVGGLIKSSFQSIAKARDELERMAGLS